MADLELAPGARPLAVREVQLGPPSKTLHRLIGGAIGLPFGLSIGIGGAAHSVLLGIGIGGVVVYLVGFTAFAMRQMRRFATENNLALGAIGRGELARGEEVFARWAPSRVTTISALARHNLGWTLMLQGRLEEAATILADSAESYARGLTRVSLLPSTRANASLCYALLADLDKAETWLEKAQQPVKAAPRPTFEGMMALLCAVIDCRRGRFAEAAGDLENAYAEHEATLTGETLRMMRVVRAFALASADGPRNQGLVERVLGDMKSRYAGEFAFLGGSWPEMATFLAAHGLDA